jgi:5'-3' exonuclease
MGLEGVSEYLRKKHSNVITNSHLSEFAFKRIAVDISGFIYRYMSIYGKENTMWLKCFINLIILMRSNNVTFIPVFDGKPPKEKSEEIAERRKAKDNLTDKVATVENHLEDYVNTGKVSERLKDIIVNEEKKNKDKKASLLHSLHSEVNEEPKDDEDYSLTPNQLEVLNEYIRKQNTYIFSITSEDIKQLKDIFDLFNVPYIQAIHEAEQTCCSLVNTGLCDAVLSNDTDCLAHRVNIFIYNLDTSKGTVKYIKKSELLESIEFEKEEQLTDFGILVGCDYNRSRRLKNIGPVKAQQLIKECKDLETIKSKYKKDIDSINYKRCRELFNYELTTEEKNIKVWRKPNLELVKEELKSREIFVDYNKIEKVFNKEIKIVFNTE